MNVAVSVPPRAPRLVVIEGNTASGREAHRAVYGATPAESYAAVVASLAAGAVIDIAQPADAGANLPDPAGLAGYDGVFLTGSALHIHRIEPAVTRQIELMRAVYASGAPCFGSCWGLQVGAVAAGGVVATNPAGREIGFARRIMASEAGRTHPLLTGRPAVFDAPAIHLDAVVAPPGDITVLASNSLTPVQAAEIRHDGGVFWGVQYHPEFSLAETASILRRLSPQLIAEGFCRDGAAVDRYCSELETLHAHPARADLAWAHGLDEQVLNERLRLTELRNFLEMRVAATMSARGRA
jgi:GMP synthase (glutamine-hydrolysing)